MCRAFPAVRALIHRAAIAGFIRTGRADERFMQQNAPAFIKINQFALLNFRHFRHSLHHVCASLRVSAVKK
jgi:hypothetical protein